MTNSNLTIGKLVACGFGVGTMCSRTWDSIGRTGDVDPGGGTWGVMLNSHQHTGTWDVWWLGLGVDLPYFFNTKKVTRTRNNASNAPHLGWVRHDSQYYPPRVSYCIKCLKIQTKSMTADAKFLKFQTKLSKYDSVTSRVDHTLIGSLSHSGRSSSTHPSVPHRLTLWH